MKTLANCKPSEFFKQAYRIKEAVEKWMNVTDIINIRKRMPELEVIKPGLSEEERKRIFNDNKKKVEEQSRKNAMAILDAAIGQYPDETLTILALCCFVEPENVDDHTVGEYLQAISELLSSQEVISFFTSLAQLGLLNMPTVSEA